VDPDDKGTAIVGVGLRLPGARSLDELWRLLAEERCVVTDLPVERRRGQPDADVGGLAGGYVEDIAQFAASFFGVSPREASFMDPQQRLALELAWHAVEDAGYRAGSLAGGPVGVFMGTANTDYAELLERSGHRTDVYGPTGTSSAMIANRVSYWFDFRGPSMTIDTACASSLVALHQAVRSLEAGDCDLAVAGGVNLAWSTRRFVGLGRAGMLSESGLCRAFDAAADGYVRAEGGAVLLLKPWSRAVRDGDAVHAVIRGIGTNHGGRTSSLTITNPAAHADLVGGVYRAAGVDLRTVGYVEAHGPGTPLGDPIEVHGLKSAFSGLLAEGAGDAEGAEDDRPTVGFCGLGSVKSNLGHLESAAGVAGLLKVVAALRHVTLPRTLHYATENPLLRLDGSPFTVVDHARPWPAPVTREGGSAPRRAGVSSFGFGGSNAHALVEEYLGTEPGDCGGDRAGERYLVPLSAETGPQLRSVASALAEHLLAARDGDRPPALRDVAYTLQLGREPMAHRAVLLASDLSELLGRLRTFLAGGPDDDGLWTGVTTGSDPGLNLLASDEDAAAMVDSWVAKRKLDRIARLWILGWSIGWSALHTGERPQRVHLPVYPFARERYWLPDSEGARPADQDAVRGAPLSGGGVAPGLGPSAGNGVGRGPDAAAPGSGDADPAGPVSVPSPGGPAGRRETRTIRLRPLNGLPRTDPVPTAAPLASVEPARGVGPAHVVEPIPVVEPSTVTGPPRVDGRDGPAEPEVDLAELRGQVVEELAEALYVQVADIDVTRKFVDLGLDSIIAVEWIRGLNQRFGTSLPASSVYDHTTVEEFTVFMRARLAGRAPEEDPDRELTRLLEEVSRGGLDLDEADRLIRAHRLAGARGE
jgi:polyketide synthase PksL